MSFMSDLYTWVNAQPWVPGVIEFDVNPLDPSKPYYNMIPLASEGKNGEFCSDENGVEVIQFNGYGQDRKSLYDAMDALANNLKLARNSIPNYSLWYYIVTRPVGYGTEDKRIYRYSVELSVEWRKL